MLLKDFLTAVLPEEGYKCWVEIDKGKRASQGLVTSIQELADKCEEIDSRGVDAYFACSSFKTPQSRRQGNVLWVKAHWADIDCGEGKPYATPKDALSALDQLCTRLDIDFPGVAYSGSGLHCYWIHSRVFSREEWDYYARLLKRAMDACGFRADPARTADAASILRPVGCRNYKREPHRQVTLDAKENFQPIDTDQFCRQLEAFSPSEGVPREAINSPHGLSGVDINSSLRAGVHGKAFDASTGVKEGEGRNNALARYCGELLAKGYTLESVVQQCQVWNKRNDPPLEDHEFFSTVRSIAAAHERNHPAPPLPEPLATDTLPQLPNGFRWNNGQLVCKIKERKDDGSEVEKDFVISDRPVFLKGILNLEGTAQRNAYLFRALHTQKGWLDFPVEADNWHGNKPYADLFKNGVSLHNNAEKYFKPMIRDMENMYRHKGDESVQYRQFGWKNENTSFLLGDNLFMADGTLQQAFGTSQLTTLMPLYRPSPHGTWQDWSNLANRLYADTEAHGFMLLAGFAAILMRFCVDAGNGGSILSVVSRESGRGKTPMAEAIASIWGEFSGTRISGNFTEHGYIEYLVRRNNLPLVQDERAFGDPLLVTESVRKFTSGSDRGRLNQKGEAKGVLETYQTILVSLSNRSLLDTVKSVDEPMSKRIFELDLKEMDKSLLDNLGGITREMSRFHGHIGRQVVRLLLHPDNMKRVKQQLQGDVDTVGELVEMYRRKLQTSPEHRFIVWPLACMHFMAEFLNAYGFLRFNVDRIMGWGCSVGRQYVETASNRTSQSADDLHQFISEHLDCCLAVADAIMPNKQAVVVYPPRRNMYMRLEVKPQRLYIDRTIIAKWCAQRGIHLQELRMDLIARNILLNPECRKTLHGGTNFPGGRPLCWEINMAQYEMSEQLSLVVKQGQPDNSAIQP